MSRVGVERALVKIEGGVGGEGVEDQGAGAGLGNHTSADGGEHAVDDQSLAGSDVDSAELVVAGGEVALGGETIRDAEGGAPWGVHGRGPEKDAPVDDRVAELRVGTDGDFSQIKVERTEAVVAAEDEQAVAILDEVEAGDVALGGLGQGASRADVDREVTDHRDVVNQVVVGEIPIGEQAAVDHHMRAGRQRTRAAEDHPTGIDLGEAGVGVGAAEFEDTGTGLDEVIEARAGAVGDRARKHHAVGGIVLGERTGRALGGAVSAAGKRQVAGQNQVRGGVAVRVERGITEHHDVIRDGDDLIEADLALVTTGAQSTAVEDEIARAERGVVTDFERGALIEREVAAERVLGVQEDRAATVGREDRLRLDEVTEDADLDGIGADEHRRVEIERTRATTEAVSAARTDAEGGRGVSRKLGIETRLDAGTKEELTIGGSGREVDGGAEARDVEADDAVGHRGGAGPCDGRESADVFHRQDAETSAVRLDDDATRADGVGRGETDEGARIDRDGTRTEGLVRGRTSQTDEREERAFVDDDRLRVIRIKRTEGKRVRAPLLDRTHTSHRAVDVGLGIIRPITPEGHRAVDRQSVEVEGVITRRTDDDRRTEVVIRVGIDRQLIVGREITAEVGVGVHHDFRLIVELGVGVELPAVDDELVTLTVGIRRAATEGILVVGSEPVVTTDDQIARQRATVIARQTEIARPCLSESSGHNLTGKDLDLVTRTIEEELAAAGDDPIDVRSLLRRHGIGNQATTVERHRPFRSQRSSPGHIGVVANLESRAIHFLRDDGVRGNASASNRLADDQRGGIGARDDIGTSRQGARNRGISHGGEGRVHAQGMDGRVRIQRTSGMGPVRSRASRLTSGDADTLIRKTNLTRLRRFQDERLEATRGALIAQERDVGGIDHPRRGHARTGASGVRGGTRIDSERRSGDAESLETDRVVERSGDNPKRNEEGLRARVGGGDVGAERDRIQRIDTQHGRTRRNIVSDHGHADIPLVRAGDARHHGAILRQDAGERKRRGGNLQHATVSPTHDVLHF